MFSQKFNHEGALRVNTPSNKSRTTLGLLTQFHGMIARKTQINRHFGKFCTGSPLNSPPPPHSEKSFNRRPFACNAATSRCKNVSEVFGKVVNNSAMYGRCGFKAEMEN